MSDAAVPRCRLCGASPAVSVTVHEHHGMIILMQHLTYRGPLCRDCGMKVVRRCSSRTAVMGWWGVLSLVGTPISLLLNLVAWLRIRRLPAAAAVPSAVAPVSGVAPEPSPGAPEAVGS